jgi:hypothetical protein
MADKLTMLSVCGRDNGASEVRYRNRLSWKIEDSSKATISHGNYTDRIASISTLLFHPGLVTLPMCQTFAKFAHEASPVTRALPLQSNACARDAQYRALIRLKIYFGIYQLFEQAALVLKSLIITKDGITGDVLRQSAAA